MSDHLDFIPSPCIGVCTMEGDFCAGCYRTLSEIGNWPGMPNEEKRELLKELAERAEADKRGELKSTDSAPPEDEWD